LLEVDLPKSLLPEVIYQHIGCDVRAWFCFTLPSPLAIGAKQIQSIAANKKTKVRASPAVGAPHGQIRR
jgi:hypothetical protein